MDCENRLNTLTTVALAFTIFLSTLVLMTPISSAQEPPAMKLSVTVTGNASADGTGFFFAPDEIPIAATPILVNLTFVNQDFITLSKHNFTTEIGGVFYQTPLLDPGAAGSVEFWVNETGTFPYWCSVPGHRALGMEGNFVVGVPAPGEEDVDIPMKLTLRIEGGGNPDGSLFLEPDQVSIASAPIRVRVVFIHNDTVSPNVPHNFRTEIDDVGYQTPDILFGEEAAVEFWINETGRYPYWCAVLGHRDIGMEGEFIVGELAAEEEAVRGIALRAYWIGLIGIFSMIGVIVVAYAVIKSESRHHTDHREHKRGGLP